MADKPLKTRQLMHELQELSRRGFGDDPVQVEIGGAGVVVGVKATPDGLWLLTNDVA